jgi:lipopolysaccharide/colanic/teichoic acid biosynthesis glycosyltransferase
MKRAFDIIGASLGLLLLLPLMSVVALIVFLDLGWPVLFRQTRPGFHGKPFKMVKFRTMQPVVDMEGFTNSDAMRLTRIGSMLRALSVDELPELWNVLTGEMSIVGPRPLLMAYLPLYSTYEARRHEVRPGITGWAQVNGRNLLTWEQKFNFDIWYVDHQTLRLDLKIIWLTVIKVISRDGVSAQGEATMSEFKGRET